MVEKQSRGGHRFVDEIELDIDTDGLGHEISFVRLQEIIEGYSQLLATVNDEKSHDPNDARTVLNESSDKKASHALYLSPARAGSFKNNLAIYDDSDEDMGTLPLDGIGFTPAFKIIRSVAENDVREFEARLPSKLARSRALDAIAKLCPKDNEVIRTESSRDPEINMELPKTRMIDFDDLRPVCDDYVDAIVIGTISSVDFESHTLKFRPSKSQRKYTVGYDPDMEDRLVASRKRPMTVNCQVRYDLNGNIADVINAEGVEELELGDITIDKFEYDGNVIEFEKPLLVEVELDEDTGQVFIGRCDPLGMIVYAEYQGDLVDEIRADLEWRWGNIALAPDDALSPNAIETKKAFLGLVIR